MNRNVLGYVYCLWRAFLAREAEYMRKYQLGAEIFYSGRAAQTPEEAEALAIWEGEQW